MAEAAGGIKIDGRVPEVLYPYSSGRQPLTCQPFPLHVFSRFLDEWIEFKKIICYFAAIRSEQWGLVRYRPGNEDVSWVYRLCPHSVNEKYSTGCETKEEKCSG
jgi:hypothetical protein